MKQWLDLLRKYKYNGWPLDELVERASLAICSVSLNREFCGDISAEQRAYINQLKKFIRRIER